MYCISTKYCIIVKYCTTRMAYSKEAFYFNECVVVSWYESYRSTVINIGCLVAYNENGVVIWYTNENVLLYIDYLVLYNKSVVVSW